MPAGSNRYQPKDARTIETFDDDLLDESSSFMLGASSISSSSERKPVSSTQALVEFLNTTSPEEFHRKEWTSSPGAGASGGGGGTNAFFKRRKNKQQQPNFSSASSTLPSSSSSGGNAGNAKSVASSNSTLFSSTTSSGDTQKSTALQRKNYTEITAKYPHLPADTHTVRNNNDDHIATAPPYQQPVTASKSTADAPKPAPLRNVSLRSGAGAVGDGESVAYSFAEPAAKSPILPTRSRHRESSLYSGSLRQSNSIKFMSGGRSRNYWDLHSNGGGSDKFASYKTRDSDKIPILLSLFDRDGYVKASKSTREPDPDVDTALDTALLERMKKYTDQHQDSSHHHHHHYQQQQSEENIELENGDELRCIRHAQTQTNDGTTPNHKHDQHTYHTSSSISQQEDPAAYIEHLKKQIARERVKKDRLRMAYDNSCDQFEVLSGLAYKKLRVLWEEKTRWESAWFELSSQVEGAAASVDGNNNKVIMCE